MSKDIMAVIVLASALGISIGVARHQWTRRTEAQAMRDYWHAMMTDRAIRLDRIEPMYTAALAWRSPLAGPDGVANAERALLAALAIYEETPHE